MYCGNMKEFSGLIISQVFYPYFELHIVLCFGVEGEVWKISGLKISSTAFVFLYFFSCLVGCCG